MSAPRIATLRGLLAGLVAVATLLIATSLPASADDEVKVYIVRTVEENGGQEEFLFDIAERTLGDGERLAEIFKLNEGRPQPDGQVMTTPDVIEAGWILVLPDDATGREVRTVRLDETATPESPGSPQLGTVPAPNTADRARVRAPDGASDGALRRYLLGGGVLAVVVVTGIGVWILARRRGGLGAVVPFARWARSLSRKRRRRDLAERMAADHRTTLASRWALGELIDHPDHETPVEVYTVTAERRRLVAVASGGDGENSGRWRNRGDTRWEFPGLQAVRAALPSDVAVCPHLVSIGIVDDDAQLMVDLDRIEGTLSVAGDLEVARDVVIAMARGLLHAPKASTTVVLVDPLGEEMQGHMGLRRVHSPAELHRRRPALPPGPDQEAATFVHGGQVPDDFAGFIIVLHPVGESDAAELARLSSPKLGWTVLTVGDAPGAHWRWSAESDGTVDTGVLGQRVTVPAFSTALAGGMRGVVRLPERPASRWQVAAADRDEYVTATQSRRPRNPVPKAGPRVSPPPTDRVHFRRR